MKYMEGLNESDLETFKLDLKDKKILSAIHSNARMRITEIAKKTGLPKDVVLYRLNKYKKKGIVTFYAFINPPKIGYPIFKWINITLNNFDTTRINSFKKYLISHPNIIYSAKTSGNFDFFITISAKNLIHFDKILQDLREKYSDILKEFNISDILEEYQLDYCADLIE